MRIVYLLVFAPQFDPYTLQHDLSLVAFFPKYIYTLSLFPIGLVNQKIVINNKQAMITGWGRCDFSGRELCLPRSTKYFPDEIVDPMLRTVAFQIRNVNDYCDEYIKNDVAIPAGTLCLGIARKKQLVAPCMAVPGAPLVVDGRLLGLQSWGYGCGYFNDLPIIYTSIEYNLRWIQETVAIMNNLNMDNVSSLVNATKIILIQKALEESDTKRVIDKQPQKEMASLDIDEELAEINGTVFDFRDFVNGGAFRNEKAKIYEGLKNRSEELRKEMKRRLESTIKPIPDYNEFTITIDSKNTTVSKQEKEEVVDVTDSNLSDKEEYVYDDDSLSDSGESSELNNDVSEKSKSFEESRNFEY